jgi:hypothetical protein
VYHHQPDEAGPVFSFVAIRPILDQQCRKPIHQNGTLTIRVTSSSATRYQQQRHHRSGGRDGQPGDVLQSEGNDTHLLNNGIAIAKICERLNVASALEFLPDGATSRAVAYSDGNLHSSQALSTNVNFQSPPQHSRAAPMMSVMIVMTGQLAPDLNRMECVPRESASIQQPHWHRHLDGKRPIRRSEPSRGIFRQRRARRSGLGQTNGPTRGTEGRMGTRGGDSSSHRFPKEGKGWGTRFFFSRGEKTHTTQNRASVGTRV